MTADADLAIRPLDELDVTGVAAIDEKIGGAYRPEVWEARCGYYIRRDPEGSFVAEADGPDGKRVVGFMLGEVRSGEFGLEEPTGWIEVLGVDPDHRGRAIGRRLADAMLGRFRARGATRVQTLVDEDREDIRSFFASLGFEPSSLRPFGRRL
ncbi:MAG TPA: GNAT family N-acetyltransferase [Thermoanaerobaculia bacterium]|nr:GNAT family N-acetyltransferase [Thermoanaerobaculia bacterium]